MELIDALPHPERQSGGLRSGEHRRNAGILAQLSSVAPAPHKGLPAPAKEEGGWLRLSLAVQAGDKGRVDVPATQYRECSRGPAGGRARL